MPQLRFRRAIYYLLILTICLFASNPNPVLAATDPIAWWKFDDGSGTAPIDSSGNNITGSFLTPNPTWSTDVPSEITFSDPYSLDFTGNHDGVTFAWPSGLNFGATSPRSFSFWYKPVNDGEPDAGAYDRIISWDSDQFEIAGTSGDNTVDTIAYYDGNWHSTSLTLTKGTWYHITFTYDGTTAKFYIGNDLKDSHSLSGRSLSGTMAIGTRQNGHNEGINGRIDDVRIYDYALSLSQVTNLTSGSNNPDAPPATPTPTPAPTATPTPTPTQSSTSSTSTSSSSNSNNDSCPNTPAPSSAPNFFQLNSSPTTATLFFSPVTPASGYIINYGPNIAANTYATSFNYSDNSGVVVYTVKSLTPNQNYYFRVRAINGCVPGDWSQTQIKKNPQSLSVPASSIISPTPTITHTPTPTTIQSTSKNESGYSLNIKVTNNNQPVLGAKVELHSTPQTATTDHNGIAHFSNVEPGEHTIKLSYEGYSGEKNLSVSGDTKDISINMPLELTPVSNFNYLWGLLAGVAISVFGILFIFLVKKRRVKK